MKPSWLSMVCLMCVLGLTLGGCATADQDHHHDHKQNHAMVQSLDQAVAVVMPTAGNETSGVVRFEQTQRGVRITTNITGLKPNARHGFHIHEFGDATAADGTSAGGHYDPQGHPHALPHTKMPRHAGDLGNLVANGCGKAIYDKTYPDLSIIGAANPVLGRSVIIHADPDDGSQPTGNAGPRIAIGIIGVAQP